MLTDEQEQAVLQDMANIYNKINADIDNLRDKQQLFAGLIKGYSDILNTQPETLAEAAVAAATPSGPTADETSKKKK